MAAFLPRRWEIMAEPQAKERRQITQIKNPFKNNYHDAFNNDNLTSFVNDTFLK